MDEIKSWVDTSIDTAFLLVYSKSYCPYSRRAKELLHSIQRKKEEPTVFELDEMGEKGQEVQAYLLQRTGQRTVPNVSRRPTTPRRAQRPRPDLHPGSAPPSESDVRRPADGTAGKHIGGASDLLALHDAGKLEPMITL